MSNFLKKNTALGRDRIIKENLIMEPKDVKHAVVVGAGVMGNSIAQVFARAGIEVDLVDINESMLERAMNLIESNLNTLAGHGTINSEEIPLIINRINPSRDLAASAENTDFVVEAVSEVPELKKKVFSELDDLCPENTIIASNTSGLDIFSISEIKGIGRLVIAHWFAPAHIIPLVEIVPGPSTTPEVVLFTAGLMERLGKRPVILKEFMPAFLINRIQLAIADTVFEMLEKEWASPEDIDLALKMSLGIRLPIVGAIQNMDFNGLDLVRDIYKSRSIENKILDEKVSQGRLGAKTSKGFYDYGGRDEAEILKKRDELYLKMLDYLEELKAFEPV